jgi:hypothetical protein
MDTKPIDVVLLPDQAVDYLGNCISRSTLAKWRHFGKGPQFLRIGSRIAYRRSALDAWLAQQERRSTRDHGLDEDRLRPVKRRA